MHINRGLLFWGVVLITAGAIALAASQGLIDTAILADAWRLWPLILVAIGLSIALSRTSVAWVGTLAAALAVGAAGGVLISVGPTFSGCGGEQGTPEVSSGTFAGQQASVDLELSCGTMTLTMADGAVWRADTFVEGGDQPSVSDSASGLEIRSQHHGLPFDRRTEHWSVELGKQVAYDLRATLNAANAVMELNNSHLTGLDITSNAGTTHVGLLGAQADDFQLQLNAGMANIVADRDTDIAGTLHANAGTINLCAPLETGLQIVVPSGVAFAHNLRDRGLTLQSSDPDSYVNASFATASHRIVLQVQGNAATFNLNPEEGCA